MARREEYDVCVIGTGAGGGVVIDQLTAAGFRVVALQRGPHLRTKDFVDDDELKVVWRDELFSPDQLETWRPDESSPTETGQFNMIGHCVGGTMLHWSAWSWRFRPDEFRVLSEEGPVDGASLADWPIDYEEMEPYYERAEWDFGVSGDASANPFGAPRRRGYPNPPHPDRSDGLRFKAGARKLGYHPFPTPIAANSRPHGGRPACIYGGTCGGYGCPIGAKGTTFAVSLPKAQRTGLLDLRPDSLAFEISLGRDGRARSVRYINQSTREELEVSARHVFVCGNAVGTPHLLLMSKSGSFPDGLANSSGLVGRNLMLHLFTAASFVFDEGSRSFTGLASHAAIDDLHASDPSRGFIRGGVIASENFAVKQPLLHALWGGSTYPGSDRTWGAGFKDYLRKFSRTASVLLVGEDLPMEANRVDPDPNVTDEWGLPVPRMTHRQHPNDVAMSRWYADRMLELGDAAGAAERWISLRVTDEEPRKGSSHLHGTCRMGDDPARSVVDRWCRSHDVPNLWIADASVFPTSGGYNPTLTILANAYRVADYFVTEAKKGAL
jgi:choline dehydrogenase-like flavoprotein